MPSRRRLLCALGTGLLGAGCLGGSDGSGSPTASLTPAPTATPASSPTPTSEETSTADFWVRASNEPEPNHAINVENGHDAAHTITVTVVRDSTGETVYEGSTWLAAGTRETVYNTAEADPDGIETFSVTGTLDGEVTRESQVETNACFGSLYFAVGEEGGFDVYYSIC